MFRLLQVNCLALKRFGESRPARESHFPLGLTGEIVGKLPVTALPLVADEDGSVPDDGAIKSSAVVEAIESPADGRVRVLTSSEEIYSCPWPRPISMATDARIFFSVSIGARTTHSEKESI